MKIFEHKTHLHLLRLKALNTLYIFLLVALQADTARFLSQARLRTCQRNCVFWTCWLNVCQIVSGSMCLLMCSLFLLCVRVFLRVRSLRLSSVDQVTLGANCVSLGAQGWAALIVLWPGTRCLNECFSLSLCALSSCTFMSPIPSLTEFKI